MLAGILIGVIAGFSLAYTIGWYGMRRRSRQLRNRITLYANADDLLAALEADARRQSPDPLRPW